MKPRKCKISNFIRFWPTCLFYAMEETEHFIKRRKHKISNFVRHNAASRIILNRRVWTFLRPTGLLYNVAVIGDSGKILNCQTASPTRFAARKIRATTHTIFQIRGYNGDTRVLGKFVLWSRAASDIIRGLRPAFCHGDETCLILFPLLHKNLLKHFLISFRRAVLAQLGLV